jgi:hypothetical protein
MMAGYGANENLSGGDDGHGCRGKRSAREGEVRNMELAGPGCREVRSRVDRHVQKMVGVDRVGRELFGCSEG